MVIVCRSCWFLWYSAVTMLRDVCGEKLLSLPLFVHCLCLENTFLPFDALQTLRFVLKRSCLSCKSSYSALGMTFKSV